MFGPHEKWMAAGTPNEIPHFILHFESISQIIKRINSQQQKVSCGNLYVHRKKPKMKLPYYNRTANFRDCTKKNITECVINFF